MFVYLDVTYLKNHKMTSENYPGVLDRVKAITIDAFILVLFIFIISFMFSFFENVPDYIKMIAFVFIFLLYDPIFTSTFGGTMGHMIIGIRVKRARNEQKNIFFPLAIVRFIIKAFLGVISLITVTGNIKRKAIHDFAAGSVVVYAKPV